MSDFIDPKPTNLRPLSREEFKKATKELHEYLGALRKQMIPEGYNPLTEVDYSVPVLFVSQTKDAEFAPMMPACLDVGLLGPFDDETLARTQEGFRKSQILAVANMLVDNAPNQVLWLWRAQHHYASSPIRPEMAEEDDPWRIKIKGRWYAAGIGTACMTEDECFKRYGVVPSFGQLYRVCVYGTEVSGT